MPSAVSSSFSSSRPFATKKYSVYSRSALRYFWCSSNLCKTPLDLFPVMDLKLTIRWHHFRLPVWPLMHSFEFWWYPVSVHTLNKSSFSSAVTPKKCMLNFKRKKLFKTFCKFEQSPQKLVPQKLIPLKLILQYLKCIYIRAVLFFARTWIRAF